MNIFFITSGYYSIFSENKGPIETLINLLVEENEIQKKHNFFVGTTGRGNYDGQYKKSNFLFYKYTHKDNFIYFCWYVLYRLFECIHIDLPKHHYVYEIYKYAKYKDIDYFVVEEGDLYSFKYLSKKFGKEKMIYHSHSQAIFNQKLFDIYSKFITVSKYIENFNFQNHEEYKTKNRVLLNAIDEKKFIKKIGSSEVLDIKTRLNINDNDFVVLFVGRIQPNKGVFELVKAWNKIAKNNKKLIIIGSSQFGTNVVSTYETEVLNLVSKSENIISLGFIANEELYKYHNIADVFISPSLDEGAGLMNIEAMCGGLPIISSNDGGIPEYIINKSNGILLNNPRDIEEILGSITLLYEKSELRKYISETNKEDCKKFYKRKYYERFCDIIKFY